MEFNKLDVDTVSQEEMIEHFNIIEKNIPIMKENLQKKLKETDGNISSIQIEEVLVKSLDESGLAPEGRRILEGFYEIWMGTFMMVGSDMESLIIALRMIGKDV